jgi:hypothetical protein
LSFKTVFAVLLNIKDSSTCGNVILVIHSIAYWLTNRELCSTRQCIYNISMSHVCATTTAVEKH